MTNCDQCGKPAECTVGYIDFDRASNYRFCGEVCMIAHQDAWSGYQEKEKRMDRSEVIGVVGLVVSVVFIAAVGVAAGTLFLRDGFWVLGIPTIIGGLWLACDTWIWARE